MAAGKLPKNLLVFYFRKFYIFSYLNAKMLFEQVV